MRKIGPFYIYRGTWIRPYYNKGVKGWEIDNDLNIYATLDDALNAVDNRDAGGWFPLRRGAAIPKRCSKPIKIVGQWEV